tara:strand:- start:244 stop:414 length:171 start_codon:yes stop_codon:yes gene_type:complete
MSIVVSADEFWDRKVNQYITLWKYGKHSTEQLSDNLIRIGYDPTVVKKTIEEYLNG